MWGVIAAGLSAANTLFGMVSADKAAEAQSDAAREAAAVLERHYQQVREDLEPYRDIGYNALYKLGTSRWGNRGAAGGIEDLIEKRERLQLQLEKIRNQSGRIPSDDPRARYFRNYGRWPWEQSQSTFEGGP